MQSDPSSESARSTPTDQHPSNPTRRSGRLKHGNPSGDPLQSPRCGARTRSGSPCRAPAMINRHGPVHPMQAAWRALDRARYY